MTADTAAVVSALEHYQGDPRLRALLGPGGVYEVHDVVVGGVPTRSFTRGPRTVLDAFQAMRQHGEQVHLVFGDERMTFRQVREDALRLAQQLKACYGVRAGDRVGIAMRNLPEFVVAFWSAAVLGAVAVPLNAWWAPPELRHGIEHAGAAVVFADAERVERIRASGCTVPLIATRCEQPGHDVASYRDLIGGSALPTDEMAALDPDDPVTIIYTSGTTGRPKGAVGTGRNHIANVLNVQFASARYAALQGAQPPTGQTAVLTAGPLFHIGGIGSMVNLALSGGRAVLMRKWDVTEAMELCQREKVTHFRGVPTMARQLLDHPALPAIRSQLRWFAVGGAPVPPELAVLAGERLPDAVELVHGYGSTETAATVVHNIGADFVAHPESIGRPNLTADLRIERPDGTACAPGEVGELCVRSPQVMLGYWRDPAATEAALAGGWFHTGDLGCVDRDGLLRVVDRMKDVVIRGGENVYSAEVEAVLGQHPGVAEVIVVGIAEQVMGERVCAVVIPRPGATIGLASIRSFAHDKLAAFKCPEALVVIDDVPRTATGKAAKPALRTLLAESESRIERSWISA